MFSYNPERNNMPWDHSNSPIEAHGAAFFVIGEFLFISLSLVTLINAVSHGRLHLAVWVAAFAAGTANDAIFMMLPMVDNFWQAQVRNSCYCIL